ncbi:MAG: BMP family lipoprotein [Candidatus Hodarchaeales archaeon]
MKKSIYVIILFLFGSFMINDHLLTGNAKIANSIPSIAIVFAPGELGINMFNDVAYQGLVDANTTYFGQFTYTYAEPVTNDESEDDVLSFAEQGYDLIICVGFPFYDILNKNAPSYPEQRFTLIDSLLDLNNVSSITFKEQEGSFLVGAMAAMTTQTGKVGFLGGKDIYLINKFLAGYQQGVHFINSSINITPAYSPNLDNCWGDIEGGKLVGEKLLSEGNDIIYTAAGRTGLGAIQAVNESTGVYAIGVDTDQDYLAKGKILASMLKKINVAVYNSIEDIILGNWSDGHTELDLADDGVGISPMTYTASVKNGAFTFNNVTRTRWEWIQDIIQNITDGTIVVNDIPEKPVIIPKIGILSSILINQDDYYHTAALNGINDALVDYEGEFTYKIIKPVNSEDINYQLEVMVNDRYDFIICVGFLNGPPLQDVATSYPGQKFTLIDGFELNLPNVAEIVVKEHEGSFLAGAMAAMTTQTGKIGFLGGVDNYKIGQFLAGYEQGAHYIDEYIRITVTYSENQFNPWNDISAGTDAGWAFIDQDHDIIYTAAGGTGIGVIQAVNETNGVYVIGVDSDQDYLAPGKVLTSMVKGIDTAVYKSLEDCILNTWRNGRVSLGIAENGVRISPMTYTEAIKNGEFTFNDETKTRWEWIEEIKQRIIDGEIIVSDTPIWDYLSHLSTNTDLSTVSEITSWPNLNMALLGFLPLLVILRKRRKIL